MSLDDILANRSIRTLFQPVVDLDLGTIVAYEALSRGPVGELERPDLLFAAARDAGRLAELDELCRRTALDSALRLDWPHEVALFVNIEPQVLEVEELEPLIELAASAPQGLDVVLEITERAISARPADLLTCVRRLRQAGWRIALDDVGADDMSLAFMPLLRPDLVKLDLRLVQDRPGPAVAQIMNAVNAYAQRSGAQLLAEGIENETHLQMARALGARLGQGWMFGRPSSGLNDAMPTSELLLPPPAPTSSPGSPFECLPADTTLRTSTKALLIELSKHLEEQARGHGATCVVVSTFQYAKHFTPATARRYERLATQVGFVAAIGEGLTEEPAPGVRGAAIHGDDRLRGEWDVAVLAPHFSAALLARDLGDDGPDAERRFEFALTYERSVVSAAAESLLSRVAPLPARTSTPARILRPAHPAADASGDQAGLGALPLSIETVHVLHRALQATTNGVAIADVTRPDQPLIFVNAAFERLSGLRADQVLGTNCRVLQGPDTDPAAIARIRTAIRDGEECRETVLNQRHGSDEPWWNEIHLAPIRDEQGRVVQYVGVQSDVTARVQAEQALEQERARSRAYLAEIESLAFDDPLTGLRNRRSLRDVLDACLRTARAQGTAVALLYIDLDDFKLVNDTLGHAGGDALLTEIASRLQEVPAAVRARIGGDEFVVVLDGLDPRSAMLDAKRVARDLRGRLPVAAGSRPVSVSIGVSVHPHDGADFDALITAADRRMYDEKAHAKLA